MGEDALMSDSYTLKEYYVRYLKNVRQVKDSTANHYIDALNHITRYLVNKDMVEKSIYEISEIGELEVLRTFLKNDKDFIEYLFYFCHHLFLYYPYNISRN